ncbi:MAG: hypothetical protein GY732_09360 [Gammaproteobacteria bacterium]|nr:hypothetical protein [Gammaproteobacteria bacterium]
MARTVLHEERAAPIFNLFLAEMQALEEMDIPHVTISVGGRTLRCGVGPEIHGCVRGSGLDRCRNYLRSLNTADCEAQLELIQASVDGRTTDLTTSGNRGYSRPSRFVGSNALNAEPAVIR